MFLAFLTIDTPPPHDPGREEVSVVETILPKFVNNNAIKRGIQRIVAKFLGDYRRQVPTDGRE